MSSGLYSGVSGLAIGVGLYKGVSGLWGGASGLIDGFGGSFSPTSLFAAGEPGGWYDPSDLSTMFQDSAGTTPVTATGQTVARINDKSGRGNHLTQATAASRPIYGIEPFGGRRNLLTWTEQFDNAAWIKTNTAVTANSTVAPDGTPTADTLTATATAVTFMYRDVAVVGTAGTFSFYIKPANIIDAITSFLVQDLTAGSVTLANGVLTWATMTVMGAGASIAAVSDGWYRVSLSSSSLVSGNTLRIWVNTGSTVTAGHSFFLWGAQLETGSLATPYQRVTDQWNVTEAGVPSVSYLAFDGTDDWFISPTITPGIDKAQVFAGVRKLSDAAEGMLLETSTTLSAGSLRMYAPRSASNNYSWRGGGSSQSEALASGYTAPITNVLTGIGDIAADTAILRVNGVQAATSATDQGTGNYQAYPLYIGRRAGTGLPFNGRIYQLIVRFGANLDAATIAATETFVNSKTGAY